MQTTVSSAADSSRGNAVHNRKRRDLDIGKFTWSGSGGGRALPAFRLLFRLAVLALLPGMLAGALLAATLRELTFYSGWIGVPGTALAVVALEAAVGAAAVGYWRERFSGTGAALPALPLFALYCFFPLPMVALAVAGIGVGGWLTAQPAAGSGVSRFCFGVGLLAASAVSFLQPENSTVRFLAVPFLFAPTMAVTLLCACRGLGVRMRILLVMVFPLFLIGLGQGMTARISGVARLPLAPPSLVRAALPASLLPDQSSLRVLFLSDRVSALPRVWAALPYVESIECVWPSAPSELEPSGRKVEIFHCFPGRSVLSGRYDLIFVEGFGPGSPASKRFFAAKLWRDHLAESGGVLVLPRREAPALPEEASAIPLPGAGAFYLAAGRTPPAAGLGELDRRLQRLQGLFSDEMRLMPPGIFEALYFGPPEPAAVPVPAVPAPPENFWLAAGMLLAAYALVRLYFGRMERNSYGFALFENYAAFALVLVAAAVRLDALELTGGIAGGAIWALLGFTVFNFPFRPRAEWVLALLAALIPAIWFLSGVFLDSGGGYWLAAALCALAAGVTRVRICALAEFPRTWNTLFCGTGLAAGAVAAALLVRFTPDPVLPAVAAAAFLRLGWLLRI